jgi:predicted PurR-regulated permease PerM
MRAGGRPRGAMSARAPDRSRRLENAAFLVLLLFATALFAWTIRSFLVPIFWAAVFAVLFNGIHDRLLSLCRGRRNPAALLATLTVIVFVVVPFGLVLGALAQQGLLLYQGIASGEISVNAPIDVIERSLPAATRFLEGYGVDIAQLRESVQAVAAGATQLIARRALGVGQDVLWITLLFGVMLYLLFFFFRDGERIVARVARVIPLGDDRRTRLLLKFAQVSRATVKGSLIVAAAQGGLGVLLFLIVGIETAVFWGVIMAVLSLIPALGAGLVWLPAAVILLANGQIWEGVIVLLGGVFVIGIVDNVLRPIVIGRDTRLPDYLVLISTLGGIAAFGLAGFVAGPIIAALFLVMWELFAEEYNDMPAATTPVPEPPVPERPVPGPPLPEAPLPEAPLPAIERA